MKEREYIEDFTVGEKIISPSRTITEADIVNFAMLTGDWHPIHVDKEYAKTTPFGERIAHGMLTITLGGALMMWTGPNTFVPKTFIAFIGLENVRILKPTLIGDTLHCECTVAAAEPKSGGRGMLTYNTEIRNQRDEVCVTSVHKSLCLQRPK